MTDNRLLLDLPDPLSRWGLPHLWQNRASGW